jgi:hypothetical protein
LIQTLNLTICSNNCSKSRHIVVVFVVVAVDVVASAFFCLLSVPAEDGLHLVLGGVLLVLLEEFVTAAHAPFVRLRQAGAVRAARAWAQIFPVVFAGPRNGYDEFYVKYKLMQSFTSRGDFRSLMTIWQNNS